MGRVQARVEGLDRSTFHGVPIAGFEDAGRSQLILLLMAGLEPGSKVVDIGCGMLRAGYWLIHFLDPGCYHGIEPHTGRLDLGRGSILEQDTLAQKRPRFDANADFDTSVFGTRFDVFLAYSIWTHAAKRHIEIMLDRFITDSTPQAFFLTSVLPSGWRGADHAGDAWVGTSHESATPGCIRHSLRWIEAACRRRDLHMRRLGRERDGQTWLLISRDPDRQLLFSSVWLDGPWARLERRVKRLNR